MCGRFTVRSSAYEVANAFPQIDEQTLFDLVPDWHARFNVAPTQDVLLACAQTTPNPTRGRQHDHEPMGPLERMLREEPAGELPGLWRQARWGLESQGRGLGLINARSETVASKPTFRDAFRYRRCLIPADGFFEWTGKGRDKQAFYFTRPQEGPFAFAGIWDALKSDDSLPQVGCVVLTTQANELMEQYHHRMPVVIHPQHYEAWLTTPANKLDRLTALLQPTPASEWQLQEVSAYVNSARHEGPRCIEPPPHRQASLF